MKHVKTFEGFIGEAGKDESLYVVWLQPEGEDEKKEMYRVPLRQAKTSGQNLFNRYAEDGVTVGIMPAEEWDSVQK